MESSQIHENEHVLVTGATGFIGSHVIQRLIAENSHRIVALVRKIAGYKSVADLQERGVILAEGAFHEQDRVKNVFQRYPIRSVIHLAALRGAGVATSEEYQKVNVSGTEVLLDVSLKHAVKMFVYCSSVGVFGTIPHKSPAGLDSPLNGDNDYHKSKIQAESAVKKYMSKGLDAVIVRSAIAYGRRDNGFPAKLVDLVKKHRLVLPMRDNYVHMVSVTKLAELLVALSTQPPSSRKIFIAVDQDCVPLRALADLIHMHYFGKPYPRALRAPRFVYAWSARIAEQVGSQKWAVRLKLISQNWCYEADDSAEELSFHPGNTLSEFKRYLEAI